MDSIVDLNIRYVNFPTLQAGRYKPPQHKNQNFLRCRVVSPGGPFLKMTVCRFGTTLFERNDNDDQDFCSQGSGRPDDPDRCRAYPERDRQGGRSVQG
jgi:hypothetical protein